MKKRGYWVLFFMGLITFSLLLITSSTYAVIFYPEQEQYVMTQMRLVQYVKTSHGQFVTAKTNPQPAVKPVLDISGIKEILSIPVGKRRRYIINDKKPGRIPAEKIMESIANLAVMQFDVENFTITIINPDGKEETIIGGEFGRILRKEILGLGPGEFGLSVKHTEFVQTPGLTPKFDEKKYRLILNNQDIDLVLARDMGRPDKGFPEWGVHWLLLKRYVPNSGNPPQTEELSFFIDYKDAIYTIRILAPDGRLLEWEQWVFVQGNPNPVKHRPRGP